MRSPRPEFSTIVIIVFALVSFVVAAFAGPAAAQSQTPPRFDEVVVVTPQRTESTLDRAPAFVTLLDEEDIAASPAEDVPDLLRRAGLHVTDVTGNQRSYRVDLRGFGATAGSNTLVLVDGRRVNQPDLSGTDWSQVPLDRVARVEIIRGGEAAVLFGDSATGGVVNIITKDGRETETTATLWAGSYSTWTPEVISRGTKGRIAYVASARYNRSNGHRDNAQTDGGDIGGQLVFTSGAAFEIGVSGGYHGDRTGLPGALTETDLAQGVDRSSSLTPDDFADVDDGYGMVTPRVTLGDRGYVSMDVSMRRRDTQFFSSFSGGEFTGDTTTRTLAASPKVVVESAVGSAANHVVAGVDFSASEEEIRNTVVFGGSESVGLFTLEKRNSGVYVHDELNTGAVTVTGGYRFDSVDYTFAPSSPAERDFQEHAGSAGATLRISQPASVFARVSRSFRYPVLDELFDFFSNTIVAELVPQRTLDFDGGLRVEVATLRGSINFFRHATDDEIYFNPVGGAGFGANENLDGTGRRTGLELAASTAIGGVEVGGTYTVLDAVIDGGRYDGQNVPGVPTHRATAHARIPFSDRVSLGLDGLYTGQRRFEGDFEGQFGEQDGYFLLDARVSYLQGVARLFLDLKNLLGEEYSEYGVLGGFPTQRAFYPSPGRRALAGVDITF